MYRWDANQPIADGQLYVDKARLFPRYPAIMGNVTYDLPIGRGRTIGSSMGRVDAILGGWTIPPPAAGSMSMPSPRRNWRDPNTVITDCGTAGVVTATRDRNTKFDSAIPREKQAQLRIMWQREIAAQSSSRSAVCRRIRPGTPWLKCMGISPLFRWPRHNQ